MQNYYRYLKPLLFALPPELTHEWTLKLLSLPCFKASRPLAGKKVTCMGLTFENRVGLAAGLDKDGHCIDGLGTLGFGFIEVGTVTPRPQYGNPKPRLFRIPQQKAILNRMGFNNRGVNALIPFLKKRRYSGIVGVNIGKNKDTPLLNAHEDYVYCMQQVYPYADYITVNISSPNTPDLRALQTEQYLDALVYAVTEAKRQLQKRYHRVVPLLVKISPDETIDTLHTMVEIFIKYEIDGIIATNTTVDKSLLGDAKWERELGGVSGMPLQQKSLTVLQDLNQLLPHTIPLISVGGIFSSEDAKSRFENGARLIQLYSGLIYEGPQLVQELILRGDFVA